MRYEAKKFEIAWIVWDNETQQIAMINGNSVAGLSEETARRLAEKANETPRFVVRKGIEGWMVWDREIRGPATMSGRPYTGLTEEDAQIIKDALAKSIKDNQVDE